MGAIPLCVCAEMTQSIVWVLDFHFSVEKGHAVTLLHPYKDDVTFSFCLHF